MKIPKSVAKGMVVAIMSSALMTGFTQTAQAVGGTCTSDRQTDSKFGPDDHRVRASCSYLQGDTKAQGVLDVNLDNDYETPWFTTINKYYYSGWRACIAPSTCNNTYMKTAHV